MSCRSTRRRPTLYSRCSRRLPHGCTNGTAVIRPLRNCASVRGHATNSSPRWRTDAQSMPQSGRKVASWSPVTSVTAARPSHVPSRSSWLGAAERTALLVRLVAALCGRGALGERGEDRHRLLAHLVEPGRELLDRPASVLAHFAYPGRLVPYRDLPRVHCVDLAGDLLGVVGQEEGDHRRDVFRLTHLQPERH